MDMERIIALVLKDAEDCRTSAGYNGSFSDGGASELEAQVMFYRFGRDGSLPPEWIKYLKHIDPEYPEYERLKKKFEG